MAKFLNTTLLNQWIPKLIDETERELIIIVPYIKMSEQIFNHLKKANQRGVETTIIYREDKLSVIEKKKLMELSNLNLLHHPNVHAKCYYNEHYMIIGSMNLYEFSQLNNREMSVLLHRDALEEDEHLFGAGGDGKEIFLDAIREIRDIVNGAHIEKKSRETIEEGFEMNIIKTPDEFAEDQCRKLNKIFLNKKFKAQEVNGNWCCVSKNYFDNIDIRITHRVEFVFNKDEKWFAELHKRALPQYKEFMFEGFKFYWTPYLKMTSLYVDSYYKKWSTFNEEQYWLEMKAGIDNVIKYLRQYM